MKALVVIVAVLALACIIAGIVVSPVFAVLGFVEGCMWLAHLCPSEKEK